MTRRHRWLPSSLFSRALLTLVLTFGSFALVTFVAIVHYALSPVVQRATSDLAALMDLSARTLVKLPQPLREEYRKRLRQDYQLELRPQRERPDDLEPYFFPYTARLSKSIAAQLGHPVQVESNLLGEERWFWLRMDTEHGPVWVGFPRGRINTKPLEGVALVSIMALVLILVTATVLARRVTIPLTRLSRAAEEVARGRSPEPLPETGPLELANLARRFNETSQQVRELLADRTVLLAGISHDLRTPLTRLRLAVEMLPEQVSDPQRDRMTRDIEEMDQLIRQAMELGQSLGAGAKENLDINEIIKEVVGQRQRIRCRPGLPCPANINEMALRRILGNLIENALRYSYQTVEILQQGCAEGVEIQVLDRGPGIPSESLDAVFRPFFRLEQSRNRGTGGTGLGLAVARQLAMANDIEIHLGARPGGGTIARILLNPPEQDGQQSTPAGAVTRHAANAGKS
ncbi:ATP-binding protein [Thiorhodovibrio frisius]|uniref:histidine kinase n=1 Tax=Thiorhodovibrio frisius TaxID=631362 RepID=H8Z3E8_9GAMM|nr:ATP-binding protein [Thiorhodovibrio frisius]EIC21856.1 signal transduction histidine kinase [Thiorhodovibrio frisius]WPL21824.1 Osmolarity sensor protein EnvZ [Thiorhodovibrio frisius]